MKIKNLKLKICLLLAIITIIHFTSLKIYGFTMSNSNYILNMANLNSGGGYQNNSNYKLGSTVGQTAPGLSTGTNYILQSGFWYGSASSSATILFSFSLSSTSIDFGTLTPTNPITRTGLLTVTSGNATGYTVTAIENHPLSNGTTTIPDTTCDAGTCTQNTPSAWTSTLTYGFGYRCDNITGSSCATGLSNTTFYQQFASTSQNEAPVAVMTGTNSLPSNQAQITYKVNISGAQPAGTYSNAITYIATPTF